MRNVLSLLSVLPLCLLVACGSDVSLIEDVKDAINGEAQEDPAGADTASGSGEEGAPPEDGEPPSCSTDAECEAACPPDALTCACFDARCVPACEQDSDCPALPDGTEAICESAENVCLPAEMP